MSYRHLARTRAFTLVELLVVMAIIATLIAIMLPTLNKVRDAAKSAQCMSNLRQIGMGFSQYAASWDGWVLAHKQDTQEWHQNPFLRRSLGVDMKSANDTAKKDVWPNGLLCPSAGTVARTNLRYSIGGTYGFNHENTRKDSYVPYRGAWYKLVRVRMPAMKFLMMDAPTWETTYTDRNGYVVEGFYMPSNTKNGATAFRHGRQDDKSQQRANVLFFDFHVENKPRPEVTGGGDRQWLYFK